MPDTDHTERRPRPHVRFHVHADRVLDWHATAVDSGGQPVADAYGLADNETFALGGDDLPERIQVLVDQAQSDGILSAPGCHLTLWQVGDEGFLLTVDPPSPPRLCSRHLSVGDLLPDKTGGSVAAFAVLLAVGQIANQLLDEQTRSMTDERGHAATAFRGHQPAVTHPPGPLPGADPAGPARAPGPHRGR